MIILLATSSTYFLTTTGGLDSSEEGLVSESFWHPRQSGGKKSGSWVNRPESQSQLSSPFLLQSPESSLHSITNLFIALFVTSGQYCKSALKTLRRVNSEKLSFRKQTIQADTGQTANTGFYDTTI